MIVSKEKGFAFVHVPKTGGSSITLALATALGCNDVETRKRGWQARFHNRGRMHGRYVRDPEVWSFGFCRNPYDWVVSGYTKFDHPAESLHDYLRWLRRRRSPLPSTLQSWYLSEEDGAMVDFIGRFEYIERDWGVVCSFLRLGELSLPRLNTSDHIPWEEIHTEETKAITRELFAEDFRVLRYDF